MNPLGWTDVSHRAGLLLGAALFLADGLGLPWSRGVFGFAALPIAILLVAMAAMSWGLLGDWRDSRRAGVLVASAAPVWMIIASAISPRLDVARLSGAAQGAAVSPPRIHDVIPFANFVASAASAAVTFAHLIVLLIALRFAWKPGRRIAFVIAITLPVALVLLYHPSTEVFIGILLLVWFFATSFERALMLPLHIQGTLDEHEYKFLLHLREAGHVRAAELRLLLPREIASRAKLHSLGLIEDSPLGDVVQPGDALRSAAPQETKHARWLPRAAWVAAGILYLLFPDLLPGPIDDLVVMLFCSYAGFKMPGRSAISTGPASGSM